ncbi:TPA: hypothetical protein ACGO3A_001598 [Streptococcus suis]
MFTEESLQDLFEVADLLSGGDWQIYRELRMIVFEDDSDIILDFLEEKLSENDFKNLLGKFDQSQIGNAWWILLYLLANRGYLCIVEPNLGETEVWKRIGELQSWNRISSLEEPKEASFPSEKSYSDWLTDLPHQLEKSDDVVARIAMEADWYCIFICPKITYLRLRTLAENLGYIVQRMEEGWG